MGEGQRIPRREGPSGLDGPSKSRAAQFTRLGLSMTTAGAAVVPSFVRGKVLRRQDVIDDSAELSDSRGRGGKPSGFSFTPDPLVVFARPRVHKKTAPVQGSSRTRAALYLRVRRELKQARS